MTADIKPVRIGSALSITVGIGYAVCSALFWLFPDAAAGLMNALFHGLEFHKLQTEAGVFSFSGFIYALIVLMVWAFAIGMLFGWTYSFLSGRSLAAATVEEKDPV